MRAALFTRILLALLCLLALATQALAEGTWVLWKHEDITWSNTKSPKTGWGPVKQVQWTNIGVKSIRKDCEELLAKTPTPREGVYYVCLPDTIDPRRP